LYSKTFAVMPYLVHSR